MKKKLLLVFLLLLFVIHLNGVEEARRPKLTLAMIMKNEGDRYLRRVLEDAREYISNAVIIDDASTDNSREICFEVLEGIPLHLITNKESKFSNEVILRSQLWEETLKTNPEWILVLDADEIFEKRFREDVRKLISAPDVDLYYFRLYDFWDEKHYRDDKYWKAHEHYAPFLIRYRKGVEYKWRETAQHCGRLPLEGEALRSMCAVARIKHYGWARKEDRAAKYERYKKLDPDSQFGWKGQYESILDENPNLVVWEE